MLTSNLKTQVIFKLQTRLSNLYNNSKSKITLLMVLQTNNENSEIIRPISKFKIQHI